MWPLAGLLAGLLVGCTAAPEHVSVFAAASLRAAMEDAAETYRRAHPDVSVRVASAGSQVLARQIENGAMADVFVPASVEHVEAVGGHFGPPHPLACTRLVMLVPRGSTLRSLRELPRVERLVLGAPEVPIGKYSEEVLSHGASRWGAGWRAQVESRVVSRELDARRVVLAVALGEADAALGYRTDGLRAAEQVDSVPLPDDVATRAVYPIALARSASEEARAYVGWLRSSRGAAVLARHGFEACDRAP